MPWASPVPYNKNELWDLAVGKEHLLLLLTCKILSASHERFFCWRNLCMPMDALCCSKLLVVWNKNNMCFDNLLPSLTWAKLPTSMWHARPKANQTKESRFVRTELLVTCPSYTSSMPVIMPYTCIDSSCGSHQKGISSRTVKSGHFWL